MPPLLRDVPARGMMEPKSPKPRHRRLRNVAREKRLNFILLSVGSSISLTILIVSIIWFTVNHSFDVISMGIFISFWVSFFTLAVYDGMSSIDLPIKGYDIDISHQPGIVKHAHHHDHESQPLHNRSQ